MKPETPYAVIRTGGKQYRVSPGDLIDVELLGEVKPQEKITIKEVLFLRSKKGVQVGTPHIEGVAVHAECLEEVKGPKVICYRYKRRKNYHRKVGHRQRYHRLKISNIEGAE